MKRTHSDSSGRAGYPYQVTVHSSSSLNAGAETCAWWSSADFYKLAEEPLPPLSAHADFDNDELLLRFARDGIAALHDAGGSLNAQKCREVTIFCVQQDELRALTWLLAQTRSESVDVSNAAFKPADIERLMCWIRALPIRVNINLKFVRLEDQRLDAFLEGLRSNDKIRDLDLRYCFRCEFVLPNDIRKASKPVRNQRPVYERLCKELARCSSLRKLSITLDRRNVGCLGALIQHGTLTALEIRPFEDGVLGDEDMLPLAQALSRSGNLVEFCIDYCPLDAALAMRLFGALHTNQTLKYLSVQNCSLQGMAVDYIRRALEKNQSLLSLDISYNPIGERGARELAVALKRNTSLGELVLRKCEIAGGIGALADAVACNSRLLTLDLSGNPSLEGSEALSMALRVNTTLHSLEVADCFYFVGDAFIEALADHPSLRFVKVDGMRLGLTGMQALLRLHERKPEFEVKLSMDKYVYRQPSEWDRLRAAIADKTPIKPESNAEILEPQTSTHIELIDSTRARYVSTSRFTGFDLTDDSGTVTRVTIMIEDEMIVSGKQRYELDFDRVFPIRHPGNPSLVHPDYAKKSDAGEAAENSDARKCGEKVRLRDIAFYKCSPEPVNESDLWKHLNENFPGHRIPSMEALIAQLKASAKEEIEATLRGDLPPSARSLSVVKLTREQCDDENEADALVGQYGVILTNYAADQQPSLANGRIAGFFAGGMMRTEKDNELYKAKYGEQAAKDYGAEVRKYGTISTIGWNPYGGGNLLQFANSSFVLHTDGEMRVDHQRTNAILLPVRLDLTDRQGQERTESMLIVVQIRPVAEGKQLKLDYGADYRLRKQEGGVALRPVKQEGQAH